MKTILVIDDEPQILESISNILANEEYNILTAQNGKIGLRLYYENHIDLVITDIFMPEMDGIELISTLKIDFPNIKIIAMSGSNKLASDGYLKTAKLLGAIKILKKPFTINAFLETIKDVI